MCLGVAWNILTYDLGCISTGGLPNDDNLQFKIMYYDVNNERKEIKETKKRNQFQTPFE